MRGAVLVAVSVAACGFDLRAGSGIDAATPDDGGAPPDGALDDADPTIDAPMVEACTVRPSSAIAMVAGLLGGTGNREHGAACGAGEVAIGIGFDVTPGPIPNHANQILVTGIRLQCGVVRRTTSNQITSTPASIAATVALEGSTNAACNAYKPPTVLAATMCPAGSVLVGISGHQVDSTLFNNVAIRCAPIATDGTVGTTITTLAVANTGTNTAMPEDTTCGTGGAITALKLTFGCGEDGVTASCSQLACTP